MVLNLQIEMVKKGISRKDLSLHTGIPIRTVGNKLSGNTDWRLGEMNKVKELFPGTTLEYLFTKASETPAPSPGG